MAKNQNTEATEEVTEDATEAPVAASGKGSRVGTMPTYGLEKMDELPDDAPQGRSNLYIGLLTPLTQLDPGDWYSVASFKTPTGARNAEKAIASGARPIPAGSWEFQSRKVPNETNPAGTKWSKLFARYMGE